MHPHLADAPGDANLFAFVKKEKQTRIEAIGRSVETVHQSLEGVLLICIATADDREGFAIGNELDDFPEYLSALGLGDRVRSNPSTPTGEFPSVEFLCYVDAVFVSELATKVLHLPKG